ncbi:MAG: PEP-CTERM sorting domain-containing protein [Kiritimatiellae bacterium]|nr:PEP-CTERM sorting domain-containing protein [Kiritimatiellia bacterium]MDW8457620.1 PEP-CTERM sorting domain-containing protein [Verrucomicrobiota bacterium]
MKHVIRIAVLSCTLAMGLTASAANLASDHAGDPAYFSLTWTNGSNGGTGFGPWQLSTFGMIAGHFMWTSVTNGDLTDDGWTGGVAGDNDIDTQDPSNRPVSWGMWGDISDAIAIRPFTGTNPELEPGQTFSVDFDTGVLYPRFQASVALLDGATNPVLTVYFNGGDSQYRVTDASNSGLGLGIGHGTEGLNLKITIGSTGYDYTASLTRRDGATTNWSGTISAGARAFVAQIYGIDLGAEFIFFINSMSIVPEPSTVALAALGVLGVVVRTIRRK